MKKKIEGKRKVFKQEARKKTKKFEEIKLFLLRIAFVYLKGYSTCNVTLYTAPGVSLPIEYVVFGTGTLMESFFSSTLDDGKYS